MKRLFTCIAVGIGFFCGTRLRAAPTLGVIQTIKVGQESDLSVVDNIWLHVSSSEAASPMLSSGPFIARWEGQLNAELRGEFVFHAEFSGSFKLTVGGVVALEGTSTGDKSLTGTRVKLNKGPNPILAEFIPPATGETFVRLFWSNKETPYGPIPMAQLTHEPSEMLGTSLLLRKGRDLFSEHRCAHCHTTSQIHADLVFDAPSFDGIGSRRNYSWLAQWIENPEKLRHGTPMPAVFHGPKAKDEAEIVAAFLASLRDTTKYEPKEGDVPAGKALYEQLHCAACHNPPDASGVDPSKVSQKRVKTKFAPGALSAFLQKPEQHFVSIRMPNFHLSDDESQKLTAFLEANAETATGKVAPTEIAVLEKGKNLVRLAGCLNCHGLGGVKTELVAKPLAELAPDRWNSGCLAETHESNSKSPQYAFSGIDRKALQAFGRSDRKSLQRNTSADSLDRLSRHLNCRECHGKFEGFPTYELLGGKLKPEWATRFISGEETRKPRTWLDSRMPAFPAYAKQLGAGLSTSHGLPPISAKDLPPADAIELSKHGKKLVSADGGFSCVSCHSVGEFAATQVFEAPGINLATSWERIQPSYFDRWIRSPMSIDSTTKMPAYFDEEGKSPLSEILGGDGPKTIQAIWEYVRLGKDMAKPE